jgi:hypothetical protein
LIKRVNKLVDVATEEPDLRHSRISIPVRFDEKPGSVKIVVDLMERE